MPAFSMKSIRYLEPCHPRLRRLFTEAIKNSPVDFGIERTSVRTEAEQEKLRAAGRSKTLNSKHIPRLCPDCDEGPVSCAVDFFCIDPETGKPSWESREPYRQVAEHIKAIAAKQGTDVVWGGDFTSFFDGPHIELKNAPEKPYGAKED